MWTFHNELLLAFLSMEIVKEKKKEVKKEVRGKMFKLSIQSNLTFGCAVCVQK